MSDSDTLLGFKAGRAFRREGSNTIEPSPTKGAILLINGDDGLLHFQWKNRESGNVEEDLILFPSDASFAKVTQSPGRVYVLKFSSSNRRDFFWLQDASSARDDEFVRNLNGLLEDPDYEVQWSSSSTSQIQTSSSSVPSSLPTSNPTTSNNNFQVTPEQTAALSNALGQLQGNPILSNVLQRLQAQNAGGVSALAPPDLALTDVLSPANVAPLFTSHPELISTLFPHLPPDLPMPPSAETLQRVISSPHFRAAVSSLDQGLRTGLLGGFVRSLGLPEEAGTGVLPFLRAIQEQADRERSGSSSAGGNNMETE
ncbi:hypothetical protein D9756_004757 [Leucocoprinus leucothites]|uniref:Adhesion regulating molecule n=1 Tax=Leucocoprinus leucothites TaxID=201217 RepID=A0A8H5G976_9AGAR|nr:hypothetical protein D9756_004757 [Leucoagaricus leucothites]